MVVCPWHAWEFDCTTGACDFNPEIVVRRYPVKVEGDDVLVDVDATL
jgi:nitrite reductase/ring-hydroxylating ferredoxin subunit